MIYIIIAFLTGGLVILSMIVNSNLAKRVGTFQGTFINYTVGILFTAIILLFNKSSLNISIDSLASIPFWAYLGGAIGVMVVAMSNIIIPKIPTIYSTLLIFMGQLFTGIVIDSMAGSLVSKGKIIGGLLIVAGLVYNFNLDKRSASIEK